MQLPEGIILIDKPSGITSFDVIRRLRQKLQTSKIGHAGTLDPLASGLLIIGIGVGTKHLSFFLNQTKKYRAEILLGVGTDSGDTDGKVLQDVPVPPVDKKLLEETLAGMVGVLRLPIPIYSAIKRGGEPLYKKARRGEHVVPSVRDMEVSEMNLYDSYPQGEHYVVVVECLVESGTYVRSLAEELGRRLNVPATICGLRRLSIGEARVEDAKKLEEI